MSLLLFLLIPGSLCHAEKGSAASGAINRLQHPVVITQLPLGTAAEKYGSQAEGTLRADYGEGGRLLLVSSDGSTQVLTKDFHSASDPTVSFNGKQILFAGKKTVADSWDIFEMDSDGSNIRQVTSLEMECRSPDYQSTFYTIVSTEPWYQLTFVGVDKESLNEYGVGHLRNLYSCKTDGSAVRQLTFNLSSDMDPFIFPDGRIVYASWQRSLLNRGLAGRIILCGINSDGTDHLAYSAEEGKRVKQMPCVTTDGLVVFVESEKVAWDGSGSLGSVSTRRPLHSYRPLTEASEGLFHSPSPVDDGMLLVSKRAVDGSDSHGVYRLDPSNGQSELIYDDPGYHDIQARSIQVRKQPDGRSSVVKEENPNGKLYCLNVYTNGLEDPEWMPRGTVKRLRVLEGLPQRQTFEGAEVPVTAKRRILGEVDVESDGSFNLEIPANIPVQLQTLDENGLALQTCEWIWVKNHESRGCIGCHEDRELTPENSFVDALKKPSVKVLTPVEERRTVDFQHDVVPIIQDKCTECHGSDAKLKLTSELTGEDDFSQAYKILLGQDNDAQGYVHRNQARTSPAIWHIYGENTSQPWDGEVMQHKAPAESEMVAAGLTDEERKTFVEWVDLGAIWNGTIGAEEN
jgi:hypothetical protein